MKQEYIAGLACNAFVLISVGSFFHFCVRILTLIYLVILSNTSVPFEMQP